MKYVSLCILFRERALHTSCTVVLIISNNLLIKYIRRCRKRSGKRTLLSLLHIFYLINFLCAGDVRLPIQVRRCVGNTVPKLKRTLIIVCVADSAFGELHNSYSKHIIRRAYYIITSLQSRRVNPRFSSDCILIVKQYSRGGYPQMQYGRISSIRLIIFARLMIYPHIVRSNKCIVSLVCVTRTIPVTITRPQQ